MTTVAQLQTVEGITATPKATPQSLRLQQHHLAANASDGPLNRAFPPQTPLAEEEEDSKEHPCKRHRPLKEGWQEAFSKESSLVRVARWTYEDSNPIDFSQKGVSHLSVFCEIASSAHLLDSSIFVVQDTWYGRKDLRAANWAGRNLPKHICFFRLISPLESPKIIGLQDIHSTDALCHHGSLCFVPGVARRVKTRELSSITCGSCITSWD